jgi:hypothetical protein
VLFRHNQRHCGGLAQNPKREGPELEPLTTAPPSTLYRSSLYQYRLLFGGVSATSKDDGFRLVEVVGAVRALLLEMLSSWVCTVASSAFEIINLLFDAAELFLNATSSVLTEFPPSGSGFVVSSGYKDHLTFPAVTQAYANGICAKLMS